MPRIYDNRRGGLNESDRLELARLLIKAGYAAWVEKEKTGTGKYVSCVAYIDPAKIRKECVE